MSKTSVLVRGVPTDEEVEQMLDALGLVEEADEALDAEPVDAEVGDSPEPDADDEDEGEGEGSGEGGDIVALLRVALANTFAMYLRAHVFHWNTVGPNFVADHKYLDELNAEVFSAVDPLAEHIRVRGGLAPSGLAEFALLSEVNDPGTPEAAAPAMWEELHTANDMVIGSLQAAFDEAEMENDQGLMNFLADRIDRHGKHGWFLRSLLGQV